ncbi:MAG: N-acetylglucosamine-6-phosphate deacetylase [Candidatus Omnitrophica bacterium]|nr:N-acetylglucosamine-6-phosphate deacetylase [Candidatus Omnitrophota bacterium]
MQIVNGQIILQSAIVKNTTLLIENGRIKRLGKAAAFHNADTIDAKGFFISPGFIDSHIHGDPAKIFPYEIRYGTTAIVPAISCGLPGDIARSVNSIKHFRDTDALGPSALGLRLEGPFISKEKSGAQDKRFIKPPSPRELRGIIKRCGGLLRIVTLAPELKGAGELIRILRKNGIIASMGHTNAGYEEGIKGIDAGMTHATHLFNGMRRVSSNEDSAAIACLADKHVWIEIICDLIHVRAALLRLAIAAKRKNIILITDSVRAEAHGCGISGGVYRLKDGTIAGSRLTMIEAVKNAVRSCGVQLKDAVAFATINPARLLGIDAFKGSIARGKDADIVIFDKNFDVKMTIARGKIAYRKRGF